jgi:Glycosyltransferase family 87
MALERHPNEIPTKGAALPAVRLIGALGLLGVLISTFLLAAGAAHTPSMFVPASHGGFPGWLSGPFHNLGVGLSKDRLQLLLVVLGISYALVLVGVRSLPASAVYLTIIAAHLILLAGPVLFSQDLFGYLSYARLGVLHGLDPYTHTSSAAPFDAIYPFLGWHGVSSPYGPLFTLVSYALVPLGVAGAVWALKTLAVAASLAGITLVAYAAKRLGQSPKKAAAFMGLNPVLLALAVGGGHNDTILVFFVAAALALSSARTAHLPSGTAAMVAAVGIKLSAGLMLPFMILSPRQARERLRLLISALIALVALATVAIVGFGSHALGFVGAVRGEQQLVATHSIPAQLARLVGLSGTPGWWRDIFALVFLLVLIFSLWRTAQGTDWRLAAGWTMLALLLCTAWFLPWYVIWLLPLACVTENRRLRAATLAFCAYALATRLAFADVLLSP